MTGVLRVYRIAECDEHGVPLDWGHCRGCSPSIDVPLREQYANGLKPGWRDPDCRACGGHGSLRAAALYGLVMLSSTRVAEDRFDVSGTVRCEDCQHPMSGGTWDSPFNLTNPERWSREVAYALRRGCEVSVYGGPLGYGEKCRIPVHYSPCDERCDHGGPGRMEYRGAWEQHADLTGGHGSGVDVLTRNGQTVEASWRQVDVRCLDWPHDLRPQSLAVLCLRCLSECAGPRERLS